MVCVCIITYHRPQGLARLLDGLNALRFEETSPPGIHIIVVDNDPDGSAQATCQAKAQVLQWPLEYVIEPRRGIPQARNTSVQTALQFEPDFIAFIDDDEVPEPNWLAELLHVQHTTQADIVTGPVIPFFEQGKLHWLAHAGFFDRWRLPTGQHVPYFSTNNVLLCSTLLASATSPFDERLALTGGSDTMLSHQLKARGCRMIWADEAVVHEYVPESRMRMGWVLRRAYRRGNATSIIENLLNISLLHRLLRFFKGLGHLGLGIARVPLDMLRGRASLLRAACRVSLGLGMISGMLGIDYEEYRTIHGS